MYIHLQAGLQSFASCLSRDCIQQGGVVKVMVAKKYNTNVALCKIHNMYLGICMPLYMYGQSINHKKDVKVTHCRMHLHQADTYEASSDVLK